MLTETQARDLHLAGELYTVLVGPPEKPHCVVEVVGAKGYIGVEFLDEELRDSLVYSFQRVEDGRLFLNTVTSRTYRKGTDEVIGAELYHFKREGSVELREVDVQLGSERIGTRELEVSVNYEAWPDFGRYEHLIQRERGLVH